MKSKFKVGQWVRGKDGKLPPAKIVERTSNGRWGTCYIVNPHPGMGTMGHGTGGWAYRPYFEDEIEPCSESMAWDQEAI
jgi:hypothetical protein